MAIIQRFAYFLVLKMLALFETLICVDLCFVLSIAELEKCSIILYTSAQFKENSRNLGSPILNIEFLILKRTK